VAASRHMNRWDRKRCINRSRPELSSRQEFNKSLEWFPGTRKRLHRDQLLQPWFTSIILNEGEPNGWATLKCPPSSSPAREIHANEPRHSAIPISQTFLLV
jgi:hypothetical protein